MKVLVPAQLPTPRSIKMSNNFFAMQTMKHCEAVSEFHSRSELYFGALLESDVAVQCYVPQPFRITLPSGRKYQPDFWVKRITGQEIVYEVTTPARRPGRPVKAATRYLESYGMMYRLVETPAIFQRELEAENWLAIIRRLTGFRELELAELMRRILTLVQHLGATPLGYLVEHFEQQRSDEVLVAAYRLLHEGRLGADLETQPISLQTEVNPDGDLA
jgi:hypothetical protein